MSIGSRVLSVTAGANASPSTVKAKPRVSLVIPARNEARNLVHVLPYVPDMVDEVILVDGHSADDTIAVAQRLLPGIVIVRQEGKGKGDALRAGFAASTGDILVMMDADGSTDPGEIPRYVSALQNGADYAKGSRFAHGGGSADITGFRKLGNRALSEMVNVLFGTRYSDLCYGYNAFVRECLECMTVDCDGFEVETLLSLRAQKAHLQIAEVPSYEHTRIHGASNLRAIRDGLRVMRTILVEMLKGPSTITDARCIPALARRRVEHAAARHAEERAATITTIDIPAVRGESLSSSFSGAIPAVSRPAEAEVAVVIAAFSDERWPDLIAAVESVRAQTLRPREIVVMIDHNDGLLKRARAQWQDISVVANAEARGLSGARNTGIAATSSAQIAFLDDDAVAEPEWLERLASACDNPLILGVGGWIMPTWRAGKPQWFPDEFGWVVGCSYEGLPRRTAPIRNVFGSSMLIRREVFAEVGGFRHEVGRIGAKATGCEETELCVRALQRWPQSIFMLEPEALIQHAVPAIRSRWRYFFSRCYHEGRSKANVVRMVGGGDGLSTERAYTLAVLPRGVARGFRDAVTSLDMWGLARAFAIVAGLTLTTTGYLLGRAARIVTGRARTRKSAAQLTSLHNTLRVGAEASSSFWNARRADAN